LECDVTETRTTYFELPNWSVDTPDGPSREDFNGAFANIEARAAYDDGAQGSVLPSTLLKPGRYAKQTVSDGYALHRRNNGGGWDQVGGTVWSTRVRYRGATSGDVVLSSDVAGSETATLKAGGELATPGIIRSSAVVAAGADLTADLSAPANTGRSYVRTRASGERGLVLSAHDNAAGPLLSAQESGGTFPTTIDSRGRFRSQVAAALGAASPVDTVPLLITPGVADVTALDLAGKTTGAVPALRAYADAGDGTPIASILPTTITLGKAAWGGGAVNLVAPAIALTGAVAVTGNQTVTGSIGAASAAIAGAVTAEAAKVTSFTSGSTMGMRSQIVVLGGGSSTRDMRQPMVWRKRTVNIDVAVTSTSSMDIHTFTFVPRTTCHLDLTLTAHFRAFAPGSSGQSVEPCSLLMKLRILDVDDNVLYNGDEVYELTLGAFDTWDVTGRGELTIADAPTPQLSAGVTYKIQLYGRRNPESAISLMCHHVMGVLREAVVIG
jgi:hypothetical protein